MMEKRILGLKPAPRLEHVDDEPSSGPRIANIAHNDVVILLVNPFGAGHASHNTAASRRERPRGGLKFKLRHYPLILQMVGPGGRGRELFRLRDGCDHFRRGHDPSLRSATSAKSPEPRH